MEHRVLPHFNLSFRRLVASPGTGVRPLLPSARLLTVFSTLIDAQNPCPRSITLAGFSHQTGWWRLRRYFA